MSDLNEDLSEGLAAELTGSLGVPDDATTDDVLPNDLADAVEEQERHLAERDIPVNSDVDDTREGAEQREAEQAQKRGRGQKVPLAALHEERQKRQALELQLQAQTQQMQQWQAQFQAQQQAAQQVQREAELPDIEEDPIAYIKAREKQIAQELENLKNGHVQQPHIQQQAQVQQVEAQVMQEASVLAPVLSEAEVRFEKSNPDYPQACDHLMATVDQNMRAQHPGINEQQLGMLRTAVFVAFTKQCQANGVDPAAHIYQQAQKLGYQAARRAPRVEPPTSLANAHGSSRAPDERSSVRVSDISEMSEKEFDAYWADMKRGATVRPAF
jgi:hypothetical protein